MSEEDRLRKIFVDAMMKTFGVDDAVIFKLCANAVFDGIRALDREMNAQLDRARETVQSMQDKPEIVRYFLMYRYNSSVFANIWPDIFMTKQSAEDEIVRIKARSDVAGSWIVSFKDPRT